jgi:hypothetical protein
MKPMQLIMDIANVTLEAIDQAQDTKKPIAVKYTCKAGNVIATFVLEPTQSVDKE